MHFDHRTHAHALGKVTEAHIDQLLRVQVSMPVSSASNRSREGLASGIDSLPDVPEVDSAGDLLNQNRRKSLLSEPLMSAKEVNLSHGDILTLNSHVNRDS